MFKKLMVLALGLSLSISAFSADLDINTLTRQAETGSIESQIALANYYSSANQPDKAFYWTGRVANEENEKAQFNIGVLYDNGYGVKLNKIEAKKWFQKACQNGDKEGCFFTDN